MSYFEGFTINARRSEFVFLEVDPFQVGDAVESFCWDAADVVACRSVSVSLQETWQAFCNSSVVLYVCLYFQFGDCVSWSCVLFICIIYS